MVDDDAFMRATLDHWSFGADDSGDVRRPHNIAAVWAEARRRCPKGAALVTADGAIDTSMNPSQQEAINASLHFAEVVAALGLLAPGGSFLWKGFVLLEHSSLCLVYLMGCLFDSVAVCKPCTSKVCGVDGQGRSMSRRRTRRRAGGVALRCGVVPCSSSRALVIFHRTPVACLMQKWTSFEMAARGAASRVTSAMPTIAYSSSPGGCRLALPPTGRQQRGVRGGARLPRRGPTATGAAPRPVRGGRLPRQVRACGVRQGRCLTVDTACRARHQTEGGHGLESTA